MDTAVRAIAHCLPSSMTVRVHTPLPHPLRMVE